MSSDMIWISFGSPLLPSCEEWACGWLALFYEKALF